MRSFDGLDLRARRSESRLTTSLIMAAFTKCAQHLCRTRALGSISARRSSFLQSGSLNCRLSVPAQKAVRSAHTRQCRVSAISVGDKVPTDVKLNYFDAEGNMQDISVEDLTKGKKVVLIGVPGAFTPTCSLKHLPGFMEKAEDLKAKGVDTIACVSVNDAFVMDAWSKSVGTDDKILMLADGSAVFTKAIGVELDLADKGLGIRSRRYAMLLDDGAVKELNLEEGGAFTVSSADEILAAL